MIRITPQEVWSIPLEWLYMQVLNTRICKESLALNKGIIEILFLIQTLAWDSNHSTSKIDHVELEWFYMPPKLHRIAKKLSHWLKKAQMLLLIYFPSPLTNTTYNALYSLKNETIKDSLRVVTFILNGHN